MNFVNSFNISEFIKVGQKEHIDALLKKGEVYLNPITFFRDKELGKGIFDNCEGAAEIDRNSRIFIPIMNEHGKHQMHELIGVKEIFKHYSDTNQGNIFCMWTLQEGEPKIIDPRFVKHGDTILQIYNPREFIERIGKECKNLDYDVYFGVVEYFDEDYSDMITPFMKRREFAYQKESRIFIHNQLHQPIKLCIGSIEDIACIMNRETVSFEDIYEHINL